MKHKNWSKDIKIPSALTDPVPRELFSWKSKSCLLTLDLCSLQHTEQGYPIEHSGVGGDMAF